MRQIVLPGERVALAEMTEADQEYFCRWLQDPELRSLIDDHRVPTMEDQMRWHERVQQPDRKFFSLVTIPDMQLIGNAGFVDIDPAKETATLRITIGHPEARGKGYGSEGVELLLRYGFEMKRWKRIKLVVLKTNQRAIRTYEKAGFVPSEVQENDATLSMVLQRDM